jgi:hypothetical protein
MNKSLYQLEKEIKNLLFNFLIVLSIGVAVGLVYLHYTTDFTPDGTITRISGSEINQAEEFDIPEYYPKPLSELLVTTHNHVITFSIIFLLLGGIFFFNSIITGFWKKFLMIEPFVSTLLSFSSIWAMRYIHKDFVYLTVISAVLIYLSFFIMAAVSIYELKFKRIRQS